MHDVSSRPRRTGRTAIAAVVLSLTAVVATVGTASPARADGEITAFTNPGVFSPGGITAGPDGALWFTDTWTDSIGRMTTAGVVTNFYTDPSIDRPTGITAGPDGALWFTNFDSVDRITTSGVISSFTDPSIHCAGAITTGPDGALWFTNCNSIGRITTSGVVSSFADPGIQDPDSITSGPDGSLWFTNRPDGTSGNSIGRITTSGVVTTFTDPGIQNPDSIVSGPDGALWYTNNGSIGRITTAGTVTTYPEFNAPVDITPGPDGALWFTAGIWYTFHGGTGWPHEGLIGRITTSGTITTFMIQSRTNRSIYYPGPITAGPDGAMWYTDSPPYDGIPTAIGRVTAFPFAITTTSLPDATVGTAYNTLLQAADGVPPYTFKRTSGSLPAGIKLASDGTISGTPKARDVPGSYTVVVEARDSRPGYAGGPVVTPTVTLTLTLSS